MTHGDAFDDVLGAARAGGGWAWTLIYRDLAPAVLGYLRALQAREPEDLLSETFLQVVRGLPSFDGDEKAFRSWVFIVAHHRVVDERRLAGRRPVTDGPEAALDRVASTDVEAEALEAVATQRVRRIIGRLGTDQGGVLLM